ncbi:MAG: NAD-dependent epimerase/dehydratase family protein [Puniceicoccales bacterium]|jgi:nucleoside-diphosphate-sugar epimerase|nr:NAD-dependent epimerase/dehydratase family protein [Puniceicoccales bacterium]
MNVKAVRILIAGGSGFLGRHLIRILQTKGLHNLRSFSRSPCEDLAAGGVELFYGDLNQFGAVATAVQGCNIVFHVAAKAGIWGNYKSYYQTNVVGTLNILKACQQCGVQKLIYTSTPSVIFNGENLSNVNENMPYGRCGSCAYAATKRIAEQAVLEANGQRGLATVALRPHLMWGPGDNHLIPALLKLAQRGSLFQVGDGKNWVDLSYVENIAEAHYLAMETLGQGIIEGKAYFLSQDDPVRLWEWISQLLIRLNIPCVHKRIPYKVAYWMGGIFEILYKILCVTKQPPMTRFLAKELAKDHYFDISAAKMDLQYLPKISNEEGLDRLITWLKSQKMC